MVDEGQLHVEGDRVSFTPAGEERARTIVRCHRLAERLLFDILSLSAEEAEQTACLMEHVLSPAVADAANSSRNMTRNRETGMVTNSSRDTRLSERLHQVEAPRIPVFWAVSDAKERQMGGFN